MRYATSHQITLQYNTLHYIPYNYIALHYIRYVTLQYSAVHCSTVQCWTEQYSQDIVLKELVDDDVDRIQEETGNAGKTAPKAPTSIKTGKPSYMTLAVGETKRP